MRTYTLACVRLISAAFGLLVCLLANPAAATVAYWDPNGNGTPASGTWDTTSSQWSTISTGGSDAKWTAGYAACFCAGPTGSASQGTFTVTVNTANISIGGIYNGELNPGSCYVTINTTGSGSLSLASGTCTFYTAGSAAGSTTINIPINGTGPMSISGGNPIFLNGANTYSGGTTLGGSGSVNFGNNTAFGSGTISWSTTAFIEPSGTSAYNIANAMSFGAYSETFAGNSGGVTFSGPWTLSSTASSTTIFRNPIAGGPITVSGNIGGGVSSGLLILTNWTGNGWTFSGNNTYTSGTIITNNSSLTIGNPGYLGTSGAYSATIGIGSSATLTYASSTAQTLSGIISGAGALTVNNSSASLTLKGVNTYTGVTTITAGTLTIGGAGQLNGGSYAGNITDNGAFVYNSTAAQTLSGVISGAGTLTQNGSGALTLSGTGNSYSGITTINAGYLYIARDLSLGTAPTSSTPNWNSSLGAVPNQLTLNCSTSTAGLRWTANNFTLTNSRGIYLASGNKGSIGSGTASTETIAGPITGPGNFSSGMSYNTCLGTNILTAASGLSSYTGTTTISGGRLMLGADGTLPSGTALTIAADNGSGTAGAVFDLNGHSQTIGLLTNSVGIGGTGGPDMPTIVLSGALTVNASSSSTFNGNIICAAGGSLTNTGSGTLTLGGGIVGVVTNTGGAGSGISGSATFSVSGSGGAAVTPVLGVTAATFGTITSGTQTYTVAPNVTISGGSPSATATANLSSGLVTGITITSPGAYYTTAPTITFSGGTTNVAGNNPTGTGNANNFQLVNAVVTANGSGYTTAPTLTLSSGTGVSVTAQLASVALNASTSIGGAGNLTINSVISGGASYNLTKVGAGTVTLANANTYSGNTIISAGTLDGNVAGSIPGNVTVNSTSGTALELDNNSAMASTTTLTLTNPPAAGAVYLNLSGGTQTITALYFGSTQKAAGTWAASGATHNNPAFIGSGVLNVSTGPASATGVSLTSGSNPSTYGSSLTFTATVTGNSPSGTVQFYVDGAAAGSPVALSGGSAPLTISTLTVSGSPHQITASYSGDDNNNPSSTLSAVSQTVTQATPSITTLPTATAITYGQTLASSMLTGGSGSVPGTFAWTTPTTVPGAGTPSENVTFTASDTNNYNTASGSVSLTVNQATPIITWANPADITYGTALDGTQLNACASVPGAFTYNPTNGTVLNAGTNQVLTASFTPSDTNNYNNASATVYINVNQATAGGSFTAAPNPSLPGSDVTFTATITNTVVGGPVPDGTVLFQTNGVPLGDAVALDTNGVALFVTNSLPHGSNTVTAEYAGDSNFLGPPTVSCRW